MMTMKTLRILLPTTAALSMLTSLASSQVIHDGARFLDNDNLPSCKGNDFETDFYTVDATVRGLDNICDTVQLGVIGSLIQEIISDTELLMPEFKKEYMAALVCQYAEEEDDDRRQLQVETDPHRRLANKWTWKGKRGKCKRCKNRTTSRFLSGVAFTARNVCAETEQAVRNKMDTEHIFEIVSELLVSVTKMAWLHGEEFSSEIQAIEDAVGKCEKASTLAATAARSSITLCEQAQAKKDSLSMIRKLARKAEQATKDSEDAMVQASESLVRVESMKNEMERSVKLDDAIEDRRGLSSSSDEDVSVADVCAQVDAALFHQNLAESDASRAIDIVQEMKDVSKEFSSDKDVKDLVENAEQLLQKVDENKRGTIKEVGNVEEQCDKAKDKPKKASTYLKEAKKRMQDVAKKALATNDKLSELKIVQENMLELLEILGFDPAATQLKETIQQDHEKLSNDIERIEAEVAKIDKQLTLPEEKVDPTSTTNPIPVSQGVTLTDEEKMILEMKRSAYLQREVQLKELKVSNEELIKKQDEAQRQEYYATSIGNGYEQGEPLQIIVAGYSGQRKRAINWNPSTQTTTMSQWFEKFASLLLDALERDLPNFNNATGGCLDTEFGVIVNVTEVQGVDDPTVDFTTCVRTEYDD